MSAEGARWAAASAHYLFPVRALSAVFRGKFCAGLQRLYAAAQLEFHGQLVPWAARPKFQHLVRQATRRAWVVYAKRPFAGPQQVLAYLSRYTHRVAISPRRLLHLDAQTQTVTFAWKDYADGARSKTMTLGVGEFVRRFCLHLLPKGLVKIRHFGFLSNRQRQTRLAQARALLPPTAPAAASQPDESGCGPSGSEAPPGQVCPHCGSNRLWLVEIVPARFIPRAAPSLDSS